MDTAEALRTVLAQVESGELKLKGMAIVGYQVHGEEDRQSVYMHRSGLTPSLSVGLLTIAQDMSLREFRDMPMARSND